MSMFSVALKSRTAWCILAMFVTGGLNAVMGFIPQEAVPFVQGVLSLMAIYFKLSPSQDYNPKA